MCGQTYIRIAGFDLNVHRFVPHPDHPTVCVHCSLHPADLLHWTD